MDCIMTNVIVPHGSSRPMLPWVPAYTGMTAVSVVRIDVDRTKWQHGRTSVTPDRSLNRHPCERGDPAIHPG